MHYDFVVTLKRENIRKTDLVSFILLVFSFGACCYAQIRHGLNIFLSTAAIILLTGLLLNIDASRKGQELRFRNWLLAAGLFWLGMPFFQWMFIPFVFFSLLEAQAKYPLEIGFHPGGIVINSLFKKKIPWTALQSVILKDGLLTLDFRNNTLFQKEVLEDEEPDADEDEFNDYCRSKLVNL
ncbi:MAG TPA: hypothetical protein DIC22_09815 [Chitinophagaceae bacterium]|jgi:hypothetical protein|nr:hypothetical protein [Chitinophagaceae bacterium]